MTDQDPTQRYEPPTFAPPAPPEAPATGTPAAATPAPAPTGLPADADPVATTPVSGGSPRGGAVA